MVTILGKAVNPGDWRSLPPDFGMEGRGEVVILLYPEM